MVNNGLRLDGVRAFRVYRLGKKQDNKTRPLLITLDSVCMKKTILSKSSSLRKMEHRKDVFISPDLTPKEWEANRLLHTELKRRKSAGEKNLVIRRGKIVVYTVNSGNASHQTNHSAPKPTSNWLELTTQNQDPAELDTFYTKASVHKQKDNDPFKVLIMNCQSIVGKRAILDNLIACHNPDIIIGTESWLNPNNSSSEIFL